MLFLFWPLVVYAEDGCVEHFQEGDPALFQFLKTRATVDYAAYEGLVIGDRQIVVLPIFNLDDPEEDHRLYRLANRVNVSTRHSTVRRQLTIRSGAPLIAAKVEESERLLREKPYFADAMILPARVCGERIDLLVVVRDVWTLTPIASLSREGGEDSSSGGFSYGNVLGTGQQLTVSWSTDPERTSRSVWWGGTDLLGSHVTMQAAYVDSTDGDLRLAYIERPFYQLNSRWSGGLEWQRQTEQEEIELLDVLLNRYAHETDYDRIFAGWSTGLRDGRVLRWRLGFTYQADRFFATDVGSVVPADQRLRYPWISLESLGDAFWRASNVSFSNRQEDIPLGIRWGLSVGVADTGMDSTENAIPFSASIGNAMRGGDHHLTQWALSSTGRWRRDDSELVSTFFAAEARYYYFINRRNRWFAALRLDRADGIREDEQLSSGGADVLRGYPIYTQRGDRRWLMSLERRHFTDWHLYNLIRIGGAAYIDVGRTWDSSDSIAQIDETLANAGLGLRISSSKARADRILHVDFAVPLAAREYVDGYQIVIVGKVEF
ncbi:MAG: hypothetical protein V2I38_08580 [Alcanivoracaceae bacterium]|jgi:outer membrane protein assembly factor BamA|nr:hypothetical protein [Alcanivoracaceae bacterium]